MELFPLLQETRLRGNLSPQSVIDRAERAQNPTEQRKLKKRAAIKIVTGSLYGKKIFWLSIQAKVLFSMFTKMNHGKIINM